MYEARRDGKEEGRLEGIKETQKETALKMLQKGIDIQTVVEITGLTEEEIKNMKK